MKTIEEIIANVDPKNPASLQEAASQAIGLNGVAVGNSVTITDDSTYPYSGQVGKVKSIDEKSGMSMVEFPNCKQAVPICTSLLIPV